MKHLLIVGRPGVGKTTLIRRLTEELRGCSIDGFYTEEMREEGRRIGFWLSSLDGRQALLAHRDIDSSYRVGPYKVNVSVLDDLAVGIIRRAMRKALILFIDEIGKMELVSSAFQQVLREAIARGPRIVSTGGLARLAFLDALKRRKDVELIPMSDANRKVVFEELKVRLEALCNEDEQVQALQRQADRICEMIVCGDASEVDVEIQQAKLYAEVARLFPEKVALYHLLYESRFRRLREQFREDRWSVF